MANIALPRVASPSVIVTAGCSEAGSLATRSATTLTLPLSGVRAIGRIFRPSMSSGGGRPAAVAELAQHAPQRTTGQAGDGRRPDGDAAAIFTVTGRAVAVALFCQNPPWPTSQADMPRARALSTTERRCFRRIMFVVSFGAPRAGEGDSGPAGIALGNNCEHHANPPRCDSNNSSVIKYDFFGPQRGLGKICATPI